MSAFKGTPGPWEVVKDDYGDQYIRQKAGTRRLSGFIVECRICEDVSNDDDARLIAAAPELLEKLQKLKRAGENMRNTVVESRGLRQMDAHDVALREACELIARVTGDNA